jgi:hypothetical protein
LLLEFDTLECENLEVLGLYGILYHMEKKPGFPQPYIVGLNVYCLVKEAIEKLKTR